MTPLDSRYLSARVISELLPVSSTSRRADRVVMRPLRMFGTTFMSLDNLYIRGSWTKSAGKVIKYREIWLPAAAATGAAFFFDRAILIVSLQKAQGV